MSRLLRNTGACPTLFSGNLKVKHGAQGQAIAKKVQLLGNVVWKTNVPERLARNGDTLRELCGLVIIFCT